MSGPAGFSRLCGLSGFVVSIGLSIAMETIQPRRVRERDRGLAFLL